MPGLWVLIGSGAALFKNSRSPVERLTGVEECFFQIRE
jgi:hypothetical protein